MTTRTRKQSIEFSTEVSSSSFEDFESLVLLFKELTENKRFFSYVQFSPKFFASILKDKKWLKEIMFETPVTNSLLNKQKYFLKEKHEIIGRVKGLYFSVNKELDTDSLFDAVYVLIENHVYKDTELLKSPITWIVTAPLYT